MLIKSNTKLLDVGKQLNLVIFEYFFGQFLPKTFTLYIKNTYFAKKIDSDTISWPEEGLKQFGQSQGGLPPPTQLTNTKIQMSQTSRLSRAINYLMAEVTNQTLSDRPDRRDINKITNQCF